MKSLMMTKKMLGVFVLLFTLQIAFAQNKTFKEGQKVEVRESGNWYEGIYNGNLGEKYSNMKATPHSVTIKSEFLNGGVRVSDKDIREYTGTLGLKYTKAPEPNTINTSKLENEVIEEVNFMRTQPKEYAKKLTKLKSKYVKVGGTGWFLDMLEAGGIFIGKTDAERYKHEAVLDELIAVLNNTAPLSKLTKKEKLRASANIMASDAGKINGPKHLDSKGRTPQERAKIAGYNGAVEENLFSGVTAFGLVGGYLIDYNVPSRGHRKSLMRKQAREIGVACHYFQDRNFIRNVIHIAYGEKGQSTTTTTEKPTNNEPTTNAVNNTLKANQILKAGEKLVSANNAYMAIMQTDGNFCVYKYVNGKQSSFVWCSMKYGFANGKLKMQTDGNLCVYDSNDRFQWGSYQVKKYALRANYKLVLDNDGKLRIYNETGQIMWTN